MAAIEVAIETTPIPKPAPAERSLSVVDRMSSYNGLRNTNGYDTNGDYESIRTMVARVTGKPEYDLPPVIESPVDEEETPGTKSSAVDYDEHVSIDSGEQSYTDDWASEAPVEIDEPVKPENKPRTLSLYADTMAIRGIANAIKSAIGRSGNFISDKTQRVSANTFSWVGNLAKSLSEIKLSPRQKKITLGLGGLAVSAVGIYAAHRLGVHFNLSGSADHGSAGLNSGKSIHEVHHALAPSIEVPPIKPVAQTPNIITHVHQMAQFKDTATLDNGEGYTQLFQKLYPNHDPNTYLSAYKEMIRQYGPNFVRGAHHYRMGNGDWGLSGSGPIHLTRPAAESLSKYFSTH